MQAQKRLLSDGGAEAQHDRLAADARREGEGAFLQAGDGAAHLSPVSKGKFQPARSFVVHITAAGAEALFGAQAHFRREYALLPQGDDDAAEAGEHVFAAPARLFAAVFPLPGAGKFAQAAQLLHAAAACSKNEGDGEQRRGNFQIWKAFLRQIHLIFIPQTDIIW